MQKKENDMHVARAWVTRKIHIKHITTVALGERVEWEWAVELKGSEIKQGSALYRPVLIMCCELNWMIKTTLCS